MPEHRLSIAFMSYANADDQAFGGKISALREALEFRVSATLGRNFEIFQDVDGIRWGQRWQERLDEALEGSHLLIPILTPFFFSSDYCRLEVEKFLEMQCRARGRRLILPIYFRRSRVLEQELTPLARALAEIQYRDLRDYINQPLDTPAVLDELDRLADEIEEAVFHAEQAARTLQTMHAGGLEEAAAPAYRADQRHPRPAARAELEPEPEPAEPPLPVFTGIPDHERGPGDVFRDVEAPWCPEMVLLPAGSFLMGSSDVERVVLRGAGWGRQDIDQETPRHEVRFARPFALARHPITFEEYDHFCEQTGSKRPHDQGWGRGRRPVIGVTWEDAEAYAAWLEERTRRAYRLPSEAAWEYACRAGTTTRYAFGDRIGPEQANFGKSVGRTTPVGSYPPNAWGLCDLHGNVWEWCADRWHANYEDAPADGSAWLEGSHTGRVVRGGSWVNVMPVLLRSAYRYRYEPSYRGNFLGFRVARTLTL